MAKKKHKNKSGVLATPPEKKPLQPLTGFDLSLFISIVIQISFGPNLRGFKNL
jgi:hypothetical protein